MGFPSENKGDIQSKKTSSEFVGNREGKISSNLIARTIGEGENAKNSVVWKVVTYLLYLYTGIVAVLLINDLRINDGTESINIIKEVWLTFTPLLTLALGYMFGKSEQKNQE